MIDTEISWATDTLNWWFGCTKVSPACQFCYAETWDKRFHGADPHWGPDAPRMIRELPKVMGELEKIKRRAAKTGERPRVFVNSMSDFFEDRRDLDEARLAALDAMRQAAEVDFLLLTKRPEKIMKLLHQAKIDLEVGRHDPSSQCLEDSPLHHWLTSWVTAIAPRNIWLGTTVENQEWADKRIPELLKVPAAVRFLSCEPLLSPIELPRHDQSMGPSFSPLDWVICGGESGAHARPMHPDWARSLRDQCAAAGVSFHFKQWGMWGQWRGDLVQHGSPLATKAAYAPAALKVDEGLPMLRYGDKKAAGRLLDGVEHNGMPEVRS